MLECGRQPTASGTSSRGPQGQRVKAEKPTVSIPGPGPFCVSESEPAPYQLAVRRGACWGRPCGQGRGHRALDGRDRDWPFSWRSQNSLVAFGFSPYPSAVEWILFRFPSLFLSPSFLPSILSFFIFLNRIESDRKRLDWRGNRCQAESSARPTGQSLSPWREGPGFTEHRP